MMRKWKKDMLSSNDVQKLSLNQMESDILMQINLAHFLKDKPYNFMWMLNYMPYIALSIYESYDYLKKYKLLNITSLIDDEIIALEHWRLKIKFFEEDSFAKNVLLINNIALINKIYFNTCPRFEFIGKIFRLNDMGIYTLNNDYIGNTHLSYLYFQNKSLYEKNLFTTDIKTSKVKCNGKSKIKMMYDGTDYSLDQIGKQGYEFGMFCGQKLTEIFSDIKICKREKPIMDLLTNTSRFHDLNFRIDNRDLNTANLRAALFTDLTNESKAISIYLIHLYCMLNFVMKIFNNVVPESESYNLRVKFNCVHYVTFNLTKVYNHFMASKLLNKKIKQFNQIANDKNKFLFSNNSFCKYMRHYDFLDKSGKIIISENKFDMNKPYFGSIESSFDDMSYNDLQQVLNTKGNELINVLHEWLDIQ